MAAVPTKASTPNATHCRLADDMSQVSTVPADQSIVGRTAIRVVAPGDCRSEQQRHPEDSSRGEQGFHRTPIIP
jgi:hypothetical protein